MPRCANDSDAATELLEFLHYQLDADAYEKAERLVKMLTDTSETESIAQDGSRVSAGGAMDSRLAYDMASTSPGKIVANREVAISEVEGIVGRQTVLACDSAASVFQAALKHMNVSTSNIHPSALPAIFRAHRDRMRQGSMGGDDSIRHVPQDSRAAAEFDRRFPDVGRLKAV